MKRILDVVAFDWDEGNKDKNWIKHRVSQSECEQVFFNEPCSVDEDAWRSEHERRFYALGRTNAGRHLFVAYTYRGDRIRVISARDMKPRERKAYLRAEEEIAQNPDI